MSLSHNEKAPLLPLEQDRPNQSYMGFSGKDSSEETKLTDTKDKRFPYLKLFSYTILIAIVISALGLPQLLPNKDDEVSSNFSIEIESIPEESFEEYSHLSLTPSNSIKINNKKFHGRFLHITDIHPDADYVEGSKISEVCHRGKPSSKHSSQYASKYGDAMRGCDAPMVLMDDTLDWIAKNLKDKIDFVIWTGDNIRHDNDRKIPRTEFKIFEMNKLVSGEFSKIFHTETSPDPREFDVDVIPSLGNNDVYPHNLFSPGPTLQTRELWSIWQDYIPQEQLHIFEKGAYYMKEVIPGKLAVISLNTLYWFKANPLVDSCDSNKDPGYQHLRWFGIVLEELRERGMKVWLSGHVPPMPKHYELSCYRKYAVWVSEYRDIIIGGVFGHMNTDHFMVMDTTKAYRSLVEDGVISGKELTKQMVEFLKEDELDEKDMDETLPADLLHLQASEEAHLLGAAPSGREAYLDRFREQFYSKVKSKKKSGLQGERYSLSYIGTSVIPTFNPGFRIWEYDITSLEKTLHTKTTFKPWGVFFKEVNELLQAEHEQAVKDEKEEATITGKKGKNKPDPTVPKPKPTGVPNGPGYVKQLFTPTRFVQYYMDLEAVNSGKKKFKYEVEYTSDDEPFAFKKSQSLIVENVLSVARDLGRLVKKTKTSSVDLPFGLEENGEDEEEYEYQEVEVEEAEEHESLIEAQGKKKTKQIKVKKSEKNLKKKWEKFVEYAFVSSGYNDDLKWAHDE